MKTAQQIYNDLASNAMSRGLGTYLGDGSVLRSLLEVIAFEIAEAELNLSKAEKNSFLSTASKGALNKHARDLGISRYTRQEATSEYSERNVEVFVKSGSTFGSLRGGIPNFTNMIISGLGNNRPYLVTAIDPTETLSDVSSIYISVKALEDGNLGNVPEFLFQEYSLTGYENLIGVRNSYSISNGRDEESDEDLLFRISNRILSLQTCNQISLESKIRELGSIGTYKILSSYQGSGTTKIVVQPKSGIAE